MSLSKICLISLSVLSAASAGLRCSAQSVQPLISEYTERASGSFDVTNTSTAPNVVQLEPKSFTITRDGTGEFHALDSSIHLELSMTSIRLEPKQTAHVFYKVSAENVPAWLCIYASFSPLKRTSGVNVRIMLPHTIYLYQKQPLQKTALEVGNVYYNAATHKVTAEIINTSPNAGRAASVEVSGHDAFTSEGGFPILPHQTRMLSIDWTSPQEPRNLSIDFEHFSVKRTVLGE
jgi:hypothetical protein